MVGLVIVSHSATLANGVVELARQMGGGGVAIEAAGGMAPPEGGIGTDIELVRSAIERAAGPDGVLVLMDLGSAVMSAEMAAEMIDGGGRVLLCEAPLVEGAIAAAARAGAGAPLEEVADEARLALRVKAAQLGVEGEASAPPTVDVPPGAAHAEAWLQVGIPLGLHARPAARFVETVSRFNAEVTVTDETTGRGPAGARSLSALLTLGARQGHLLVARATGPDADAVLDALRELAASGFGDELPSGPVAAAPTAARTSSPEAHPPAEPPPPGTTLRGVPASAGIVIAPARRRAQAVPPRPAPGGRAGTPEEEHGRLDDARAAARRDIAAARERIGSKAGASEAGIFDAHLLLLDDDALLVPARTGIDAGDGAVQAWSAAVAAAAGSYRALDDPYLRERSVDVEDVGDRVLRHLTGAPERSGPTERGILVVAELTPGDAADLDPRLVEGLAVAHGGPTSHAAILARALGIPAVVGLGASVLAVPEGTPLVLDGNAGTIECDPPPATLRAREAERRTADARRRAALSRASAPARTRDGVEIEVAANAGSVEDARAALTFGADGIGLLRTEFLFLDRDEAPTEREQEAVYEEVASALEGRPLIIRTLDAGADKPLLFLPHAPEENPFLGTRGIRLALAHPDLLRAQLRAVVAVAARHPVRLMFPMVATLAEYRTARALLEAERVAAGSPPIEVGVMVEVPAVAVSAERFAREVDFFSIGTNDLAQYTMAAERGNEAVAALLAGPLPPLLALISAVTAGAAVHGRWVGVCGELAGDPAAAVLLTGLGVRELSMAAPRIPEVKDALRSVSHAEAEALARAALDVEDAETAAALVASALGAGRPAGR